MAARDIQPVENVYKMMREKNRPLPCIEDGRGPLVYEVSKVESCNGVDPEPCNEEGKKVY